MPERRSSSLTGAVALIALLAAGAAAHAQIYRWVDERGVVHYGERPPSGVAPRTVEDKKPAAPAAAPAATPKADAGLGQQEREFQQRRIERESREQQAREQAEKTRALCERDRQRLALLRGAGRVVMGVDEKGEQRYLEDADRAEAIRRLEAAVAQRCA